MSARLLGLGFGCDMGTPHRKLVLLKLIDACEDDGSRIFPAVATIARAAQCSERQVQRELATFVSVGLLAVVREGGKGRGSTREYRLNVTMLREIEDAGWSAVTAGAGPEPDEAKGDTQSPLEGAAKGDSGDTLRVTAATVKGDKLSHPTPPYPSIDPSEEREARASEQEEPENLDGEEQGASADDPAKFEKRVKKIAADNDWPGWANSSTSWTVAQFARLTDAERAEAERRAPHYIALTGRKALSLGTYFADRKWRDLPETEKAAPAAVEAAPFGKLWQAARTKHLLLGPTLRADLTAFQRRLIQERHADEAELRRQHQAKTGWPGINRLHELASYGKGVVVAPELERLAELMEPVRVNSERWEEWRLEHELRGWPWLPDPGKHEWVYFPRGGPAGLTEFEAAVKGEEKADDGGGRKAAE
ncbi:helix-turn-helix domain-containing protein [Chelativorans sp.]|uniref:helix-turn-helix domain-containing protein n=1 Tax=Chelativorans sp. TaxID=2203393 RepID=UPI002810C60F|nr:helix-turn-helix domain-containing protein [Chelativorans sp.]